MVGEVKHCSYSELDKITNIKNPAEIQKTLTGRLFHGTIVEGSVTRPAIVKTWDYVFPMKSEKAARLDIFCVCLRDRSEFDFLSSFFVG